MTTEAEAMSVVVQGLVRLANNADAHAWFASFALLPITASESVSELDETAAKIGVGRGALVYWFKQLAAVGCGRFIVGRKGRRSRFEWWFDPGSVSSAALKRRKDLAPLPAGQNSAGDTCEAIAEESAEEDDGRIGEAPSEVDDSNIEHTFMLRPDFPVRILLPESLTKVEAERLSGFIRTLPFG